MRTIMARSSNWIDGRQAPFPTLATGENRVGSSLSSEELDCAFLQKRLGAPAGVRWSVVFLPPPARRVCAKARHAVWQAHVVQHPNVAYALFDEARRENDAVHRRGARRGAWVALAVLVDAHIGSRSAFRAGLPWGPTLIGLFWLGGM